MDKDHIHFMKKAFDEANFAFFKNEVPDYFSYGACQQLWFFDLQDSLYDDNIPYLLAYFLLI